ncbi:MAG: hypothetical protein ACSLE2_09980 [Lysobacterales bacterium]
MQRNRVIYPLLTLAAAALLPACAVQPQTNGHHRCPTFAPNVWVSYGDSYIKVNARKKVKPGCPLVFRLDPDGAGGPNGLDYDNVTVTIKGKEGEDGAHWVAFSNTAAKTEDKRFSASSPVDQKEGTYFYLVAVEKLGELDPRIDVEK